LPTRVFYLSQGGYDTHTNQAGAHERLLKDLSQSLSALVNDLKDQKNFERVVIMTFSEFGRRVEENANNGTDHGAAAPVFMIGSRINPGLLGQAPSLAPADLTKGGDIKFSTDFRSVYAAVLDQWLQTKSELVLGKSFKAFPLLKARV
jgi:uncharacterized protein (DUF1501 family)